MLRRAALIRTDVSEEFIASTFKMTTIGELGTAIALASNRNALLAIADKDPTSPIPVTLIMEAMSSSYTSVLTRATRRNIPEDGILHLLRFTLNYGRRLIGRCILFSGPHFGPIIIL
jgi:hypothetical protein